MPLLWLMLLAASIKDPTALRSGCAADESAVARLAPGTEVTIRYAISGESTPCYKVSVQVDGKSLDGYLSAGEIEGAAEFDQGRRQAARLDLNQVMRAVRAAAATAPPVPGVPNGIPQQAAQLIESGQPAAALDLLQPRLRGTKDAGLLALAGVAAWKSDDSRHALEYWRAALELNPSPELEALIRRV